MIFQSTSQARLFAGMHNISIHIRVYIRTSTFSRQFVIFHFFFMLWLVMCETCHRLIAAYLLLFIMIFTREIFWNSKIQMAWKCCCDASDKNNDEDDDIVICLCTLLNIHISSSLRSATHEWELWCFGMKIRMRYASKSRRGSSYKPDYHSNVIDIVIFMSFEGAEPPSIEAFLVTSVLWRLFSDVHAMKRFYSIFSLAGSIYIRIYKLLWIFNIKIFWMTPLYCALVS